MAKKKKGDEPFIQIFRSVNESYAWRAASGSCRKLIDRVLEEHMAHGGRENGKLPVTTENFLEWGIDDESVAKAEREAVALGLLVLTRRGRGGNAESRSEHRWGIPFIKDSKQERYLGADWKRFGSLAEARKVAKEARAQKDTWAVEQGRKRYQRHLERHRVIHFPDPGVRGKSDPGVRGKKRQKTA